MESKIFCEYEDHVREEWIDHNGHMNVGYYLLVFENASVAFCSHLDISKAYRERTDHGIFAAEAHLTFEREVDFGDKLRFTTQLLDWSSKWVNAIHCMYDADQGFLAATNHLVFVHVDLKTRKSVPFPDEQQANLAAMMEAHADLPVPPQAGRQISAGPRSPVS